MIDKRVAIGLFLISLPSAIISATEYDSPARIAGVVVLDFLFLMLIYWVLDLIWSSMTKIPKILKKRAKNGNDRSGKNHITKTRSR